MRLEVGARVRVCVCGGGGGWGGVGTGIQDLRSHEIIYQKRFVSKIYLCTCSNIKLFVSWDNAESPYKSRLSER